jgi:antirestriction protein ArdC
LNRTKGNTFGDHNYAYEELVAELGAATMMGDFGMEVEPSVNSAEYLAHWAAALKADAAIMYLAARDAGKAVTYLHKLAEGEKE